MLSKKEVYWGDAKTKLATAKGLQAALGEKIHDEQLAVGLARLNGLARELASQMRGMNFGIICSACAGRLGGGCCSQVMADETDVLQLLMNLLAGVAVDLCRDNGRECHFLGEAGCILSFKPIFCLNYDCSAIKDCPDDEGLMRYGQLRGRLLQEQWQLEQLLLQRLEELGEIT